MSSLKLKHSGGNSVIIAGPSSNPSADRTINLNDNYAGNGSFVTANSSGNVGISTASPVAQTTSGGTALTPVLDLKGTGSINNASGVLQFTRKDNSVQGSCIYSCGDDAGLTFRNTDGNGFGFYNGTTQALRINPTGKVLIGTSTVGDGGSHQLTIGDSSHTGITLRGGTSSNGNIYFADGTSGTDEYRGYIQYQHGSDLFIFGTAGSERMRITSYGDVNIGYTATDTRFGIKQRSSAVDFMHCKDSSNNLKFYIHSSGNLYNTNNSYNQISDQSLKENIVDAKSQWNDIKNIKIRNFNFTKASGYETHTQIGCVAQEVETVSPKLVTAPREDGIKTVATSVLYMKAIKALQEAMAKIEVLETKVAALEAG